MSVYDVRAIRLDGRLVAFRRATLEVTEAPNHGFLLDFESHTPQVITSGSIEVDTADGRTYVAHGFDPSPAEERHRIVQSSGRHGWRP